MRSRKQTRKQTRKQFKSRKGKGSRKGRHFIALPWVRKSRKTFRKRGGGVLIPSIHPASVVAIQPDEMSPSMLTDVETAQDIFDMREPYLL